MSFLCFKKLISFSSIKILKCFGQSYLYDNSEYKFNNLSLDWFIESCLRHKSEKFGSVDAYKDYQLSDNDISLLLTMKDN